MEIQINSNQIKLDQFLKWAGIAQSGSEAKMMIAEGMISVNAEIETRRGRKLGPGDRVVVQGREYVLA
jgi:ribosome-associated protein